MPWRRRLVASLSPRWPGFATRSVHVGFVVDKVALDQDFLRVLRFSLANATPLWLSKLIHRLGGWTIGPLVAAVQRQSHPIDTDDEEDGNSESMNPEHTFNEDIIMAYFFCTSNRLTKYIWINKQRHEQTPRSYLTSYRHVKRIYVIWMTQEVKITWKY
jgi:hypothetical protein